MKGYYCIYECSQNEWWLESEIGWLKDRNYHTKSIGTKHAIQISQGYNYNPNLPQIEVIDTQSEAVLVDYGNKVNPHQIMKFETMSQAEDYLLKTFTSDNGQFYSIRKIYF
jgi:hypothetical protein